MENKGKNHDASTGAAAVGEEACLGTKFWHLCPGMWCLTITKNLHTLRISKHSLHAIV